MSEYVTVSDLLEAGTCSPQCLLALVEDGDCRCRCDGEFHGVLADVSIELLPPALPQWMQGISLLPTWLDQIVPVVKTDGAFNKTYREQLLRDGFSQIVQRSGRRYRLTTDSQSSERGVLDQEAWELLDEVDRALRGMGRLNSTGAGNQWYGAHDIPTCKEAQVLGLVVRDLRLGDYTLAEQVLDACA